jgi:hypothetical protein
MKKDSMIKVFTVFAVFFILILTGAYSLLKGEEPLERGTIIDRIVCANDPEQSYALYLPPDYTADKKWPILFTFEPGARARIPMELFKPAAENYGYIVVCSNNSKNGPTAPIDRAIWAMWRDTHSRFSIDTTRIYAAGFSGGARVASRLHILTGNSCAGIIACGAGVSIEIRNLERIKPAMWYGIVGTSDFNYIEMMDLDTAFDKVGVVHRVIVFDGEHNWPPQPICTDAVEWMVVSAMKKGTCRKDDSLVQTIYQKHLSRAHNFELAGRIYQASKAYETAQLLFDGLLDVSPLEKKKVELENSRGYKAFQKEEKKRLQREMDLLRNYRSLIAFIEKPDTRGEDIRLERVFEELQMASLLKESRKKNDPDNSQAAYRVLNNYRSGMYIKGSEQLQKRNLKKAIIFLEASANAIETDIFTLYDLACAYSLDNQPKKAIKYLKAAVKYGYKNFSHMETDTDLDNIRNKKEFKELMENLKNR